MQRTRGIRLLILVAIGLGLSCSLALADKWPLPQKQEFYSPNRMFSFEVVPRKLESQLKYFEDMSQGKKNAGSSPGGATNQCRGSLYRIESGNRRTMVWSSPLSNDVAPVDALVTDSGDFVITFDNWHSVGYGDDVLAIYGSGGTLVHKYSLEDLLGRDVKRVLKSVSSRWWEGDKPERKIDETKKILVVRAVMKLHFFDTQNEGDGVLLKQDAQPESREIRIDLRTGQIVR